MSNEQCGYRCAIFGTKEDIAAHERHEHATCTECGNEPGGTYPVTHQPTCSRMAIGPHLWPTLIPRDAEEATDQ